jgi:putative tricarboxylic transport membrane protein
VTALARHKDVVAGTLAALLGVVYLLGAFQIERDPSAASVIGPRAAPLVIGAATVLCAIALTVRGLRHPQEEDAPHAADDEEGTAALDVDTGRVLVAFAMLAAYIVAFIPLGYLLSTFLFLVVLPTYVDRAKLLRNVIYAAGFSAVVFVMFERGLQVQLPPGPFG